MGLREEIRAALTAPGAPFEVVQEAVLGARLPVFRQRPRSLREMLASSAAHGEREYLVHDSRRISYAQHLALVASVAAGLRQRHGIGPGDRVAILAANCAEWPIAFWALTSLGAIAVALNGWWTADETAYALQDSEPALLIGDRKRLARLSEAGRNPGVPVLAIESGFAALEQHDPGAALPSQEIGEDDPAVILYTSGTTGRPKGAVASQRGVVGFAQCAIASAAEGAMIEARQNTQRADAPQGERTPPSTLATAPMFHVSGLYAGIVMYLFLGGKLVIHGGRFDPSAVLALIERERVTSFNALGGMGPRIAHHPGLANFDLSSVAHVGFGGAPASGAVQQMLRNAFPNAQSQGIGYGSSETVSVPATFQGADFRAHPEASGRIAINHQVQIRNADGAALPDGAEGEIFVRSAYLMREYWRRPEATAAVLGPDRWLATGDIGRMENGLLYINSRARDLILRNAENVYPVEIENRLEAHPQVREAAVHGVPHPEWGQAVKAVVVAAPGAAPDAESLAAWCGEILAPFKVPSEWEFRSEPLPRNPAGKVLKQVLTGEAQSTFAPE